MLQCRADNLPNSWKPLQFAVVRHTANLQGVNLPATSLYVADMERDCRQCDMQGCGPQHGSVWRRLGSRPVTVH